MGWEGPYYPHKRKQALVIVIIILICAFLYVLRAKAFTWEGELDPNEFDKWELVRIIPNPQGFSWVIIKNPDPNSTIKTVAMLIDRGSNVLGYRYFKDGEPYGFFFDIAQQKYIRHEYTPEQKKTCKKCHSDKPINRTSI